MDGAAGDCIFYDPNRLRGWAPLPRDKYSRLSSTQASQATVGRKGAVGAARRSPPPPTTKHPHGPQAPMPLPPPACGPHHRGSEHVALCDLTAPIFPPPLFHFAILGGVAKGSGCVCEFTVPEEAAHSLRLWQQNCACHCSRLQRCLQRPQHRVLPRQSRGLCQSRGHVQCGARLHKR